MLDKRLRQCVERLHMRLNVELLKSYRAQYGLSFREAGKKVGVSYQTWFQWESHGDMPERRNLAKLAKVLRVPELRLLIEDGQKPN